MSSFRFKYRKEKILSAPIMINLEITSDCNVCCRHCYNFWRNDFDGRTNMMSKEKIDELVKMISSDGVFHVVLTGGEPFLNFRILEYALKKIHAAGLTTSVNSNLMLATPQRIAFPQKSSDSLSYLSSID